MKKTTNYARVFVGDVARWPRERQLEKCREVEPELEAIYGPHEFDEYINNLNRRNSDFALVARLVAIAEKNPKGRPGAAFVERLMMLMSSKAVYIHDAQTGIKSTDGQPWINLVTSTYRSITQGRELSSERATTLAIKSHEAREPGLVADWKGKRGDADYMAVANVWGNLNIKPAAKAISMLPDKELQGVHPSTMAAIFGSRKKCLEYINNPDTKENID